MRCLAKRPQDRPRSADELLSILERESGGYMPAPLRFGPPLDEPEKLFGRTDELVRIEHLFESIAGGRTATVLVTGDAGIGKSALLSEAAPTSS